MLLYFVEMPTLGKLLSQKQPFLSLLKDSQLHQNPSPIGFYFSISRTCETRAQVII